MSTERLKALVRQHGLASDPVVRQRVAQVLINQRVSRYVRARFDALAASGRPPGAEAAILKLHLSANFTALADLAADVLGPRIAADAGEWGTYAWAELLLSAPGYRIGGGTDEIVKNMIAERALGLPAEPRPG